MESEFCARGCCKSKFCASSVAIHVKVKVPEKQWPVRCPGERCAKALDSWKAAQLLRDEQMAKEADALERMALEKSEGIIVKHCAKLACGSPFPYVDTSDKSKARVHCPFCKLGTYLLFSKVCHVGPCKRTPEEEANLKYECFRTRPKFDSLIERSEG